MIGTSGGAESEHMRSTEDYLDKAAEFHALAALTTEPTLKKRYADLADCYRLLAEERKRLIADGVIEPDAA
jgi:hypothetical protein